MLLTQKLLGYLNRVFNKDPIPFLALRVTTDSGRLTWSISGGTLTLIPAGITAAGPIVIDLSNFTLQTLAQFLATQPGYIVPYQVGTQVIATTNSFGITTDSGISITTDDGIQLSTSNRITTTTTVQQTSNLLSLSALVLLEGSGNVQLSNGDHLYGYSNLLYAYINSLSAELELAQSQIPNAIDQMDTTTAAKEFLDFLGTYYDVPRDSGESDVLYAPRIIASVLLPSSNNVGMAIALNTRFPLTSSMIDDAVSNASSLVIRDGSIKFNSLFVHNSNTLAISNGLFDVTFIFSFGGAITPDQYVALLLVAINGYRAGGTYIRNIVLKDGASASVIVNSYNIGPILVVVYGQNQPFQDASANIWFEEVEEQNELEMIFDSQIVGRNAAAVGQIFDQFDWSEESVEPDELVADMFQGQAVGADSATRGLDDQFDWMTEEPDEDDRIQAIDAVAVGPDAVLNPAEDANDWTFEEPDEDDRMMIDSAPVGVSAEVTPLFDDNTSWDEEPEEFFHNHFTNSDGAQLAADDAWPWMDEEDTTILIVSSYLNSDAIAGPAQNISTEGNSPLATEGGTPISTET